MSVVINTKTQSFFAQRALNTNTSRIQAKIEQLSTVYRINNDLGHNLKNYYLACLECNLKRRRRSDDKFLFTKQMKLVKLPGENNEEEKENEDKDTSLV
jgi:hypothetical protein